MKHTPGPLEVSHHTRGKRTGSPRTWTYVLHNFPEHPYEGDLEEEYGIYPTVPGYGGPVALVAGEANARVLAAAPDLYTACMTALAALDMAPGPGASEARDTLRRSLDVAGLELHVRTTALPEPSSGASSAATRGD